ncbi:hypothetical protein KFK09_000412 [Dendrobium nobile]|uniref:Uncharacterized protein n=1 Tax=Dendrobium nobile TaxID=94219 RepID=A0A8T3C8H4_DENNO|nr:hypothetical protein KFK09_000412 [Dendrobium nobile]
MGMGRCSSDPIATSMGDFVSGSAVVLSSEFDNSGDVFAMECRNINSTLVSAIDSMMDGWCVKPFYAAYLGISQSTNCTSSVCENATTIFSCMDNQTASPQYPSRLLFGSQLGQEPPNAWNRLEVYKIDDVSKEAVMLEDDCSVSFNMEYVHANLTKLKEG